MRFLFALLFVFASLPAVLAVEATPLKKGDKIVFLGDSITAGASRADGFITLIHTALTDKHPDLGIETVNAGVSGNEVPNLQARVDKDVVAKKPTIVFIYIGINDVWHHPEPPKEKFQTGLKEVIGKITAAGARVILCTPTVIGEKKPGTNPKDRYLDEVADLSRGMAKELGLQLCDLRKAFVDYLSENNKDDKPKGVLTADGVHLDAAGNKLVAQEMLKSLGE